MFVIQPIFLSQKLLFGVALFNLINVGLMYSWDKQLHEGDKPKYFNKDDFTYASYIVIIFPCFYYAFFWGKFIHRPYQLIILALAFNLVLSIVFILQKAPIIQIMFSIMFGLASCVFASVRGLFQLFKNCSIGLIEFMQPLCVHLKSCIDEFCKNTTSANEQTVSAKQTAINENRQSSFAASHSMSAGRESMGASASDYQPLL